MNPTGGNTQMRTFTPSLKMSRIDEKVFRTHVFRSSPTGCLTAFEKRSLEPFEEHASNRHLPSSDKEKPLCVVNSAVFIELALNCGSS